MTEKEKQELYIVITKDIDCGTFILIPQYVDKLINKNTKKLVKENTGLKEQIEKMKCCEICNHNKGGCSYHHNWTKDMLV